MNREVVIIAGKDPENQTGGHSSFVRATARAAMALGYEPHIFCAAATGKCIVASDIDGIPEDITDGYNGLLCSPNDDDSLAEKLTLAIQDQSLRESLGRNAHNSFELRFSADAFVKNLKIIYGQFGFY